MKLRKHAICALGLFTLLTLAATAVRAEDATGANATASPAAPLLVMAPDNPQWPDKVLPEVSYESLSLSDVVKNLRDTFKGEFDLILPNHYQVTGEDMVATDWMATPVTLQLKNVTAQEIFAAMNLYFDVNDIRIRWELNANGSRPVALLRLQEGAVTATSGPKRQVFFVGNLLEDGKNNGMTMDEVVASLASVYQASFQQPAYKVMLPYKEGQLIVVTATDNEIDFVRQTLQALQDKVNLERANKASTAAVVVTAPLVTPDTAPAKSP
jgi:hypothetical protein